MHNLFSSFFSTSPHFDDNGDFSRGRAEEEWKLRYSNQSLTQHLVNDLCVTDIKHEWLTDPIDGDKTIVVFSHEQHVSLHFFMRESSIAYCFYDRTIKRCSIEYEYLTLESTMNNFDEFILHHYNDANKNPYLWQKHL